MAAASSAAKTEKTLLPVRKPLSSLLRWMKVTRRTAMHACTHVRWWTRSTSLHVPRYGLGLYLNPQEESRPHRPSAVAPKTLKMCGQAPHGLLPHQPVQAPESNGFSFLQSIDRHVLRNQVYLYAIENGLDLFPLGVLDAGLLDIER